MKYLILIALLTNQCLAVTPKFFKAIHAVETGGKYGRILGDKGRALGPLQIHKEYWLDSGVGGKYESCANYDYACMVVKAYLTKYASQAVKSNNYEVLARVHNGGVGGSNKPHTLAYWRRVKNNL